MENNYNFEMFLLGLIVGVVIFLIMTVNFANILRIETLDSICKDKLGDEYEFDDIEEDDSGKQQIRCIKEEKYQLDGSENYIIKSG